jgi:formimidoylglutamate deiminase
MHVAEQPAEVAACLDEHGRTPVRLLADEGLLDERFTAVHAVHIDEAEVNALAEARAQVCACPTTERNLGDGIVPADLLLNANVRVSLGTDSHTQIDILEDARELEYHLRLQKLERAVLAPPPNAQTNAAAEEPSAVQPDDESDGIGADGSGAAHGGGTLEAGRPADFFTVALADLSIAGAGTNDLLPAIVFSLSRTAVRDVVVGGQRIVEDGQHRAQDEIIERFTDLQRKLWR